MTQGNGKWNLKSTMEMLNIRAGKRTFIYCCSSSMDCSGNNVPLPVQIGICQQWIKERRLQLYGAEGNVGEQAVWFDGSPSAWKTPIQNRPGFMDMWSRMNMGDTIVMMSMDRGWRSVQRFVDCYQNFIASGVTICFALSSIVIGGEDETEAGRFVLSGDSGIPELNSELVAANVRASFALRRHLNRSLEGTPQNCESAADSGEIEGYRITPINYRQEHSGWSEAYRRLTKPREAFPQPSGRVKVFGYIDVEHTADFPGYQIEEVTRAVNEFCASDRYEKSNIFIDNDMENFKTDWEKREFGKVLWNQLNEGDHVFVYAPSRVFRSIPDMAKGMQELEDKGVALHFIRDGIRTDQEGGLRLLEALGVVVQWERDDTSSRLQYSIEASGDDLPVWRGPCSARWLRDIRNDKLKKRVLIPDHEDIERMIMITNMIRNKGRKTWVQMTEEVEQEMAKFDGRRPIPILGGSLNKYRVKCTPEEKYALKLFIERKKLSWMPPNRYKGWKMTSEIHPEVSLNWLRYWEKSVWGPLLKYAAVKPELFGDIREKILEVG